MSGLPWWLSGKESACKYRRQEFAPWSRKILQRRKWQPNSVFLPGKSHGQGSLTGCSPQAGKESYMTERLNNSIGTGCVHRSGAGVAWVLSHRFVVLGAGACTVPSLCSQCSVFAPGSSEMAVGFCLFEPFGPGFAPASHACWYLVPYHFFALCSSRRRVFSCMHLPHCSKGPQTCLITTTICIPLEEMAFFLPWEFFLL